MTARRSILALALVVVAPAIASAQIIVTSPAGASQTVDPFPGFMTWYRDDVRPGATAGITTDYPRNGNGSFYLTNNGPGAKANAALYIDPTLYPLTTLGNFSSFGYDYYRASSSTAAAHLAPAMRILVDADGSARTTNDLVSLVYEPVYNGVSTVPTNVWNAVTIGATTNLWLYQTGVGAETVYNRTLADYQAGTYTPTAGFAQVTGNSLVYGINFGTGSGWSGTFTGAVDDVSATAFGQTVSYNFESAVTATPEPSTYVLMGSGLLALAGIARRRRRA